jgi:hypothetical protein
MLWTLAGVPATGNVAVCPAMIASRFVLAIKVVRGKPNLPAALF